MIYRTARRRLNLILCAITAGMGGLICLSASAYVVDNLSYEEVHGDVTNNVLHDWGWAVNQVNSNGGGMITFNVAVEGVFTVHGATFRYPTTIHGMNKGLRVQCSGTLTMTNNSTVNDMETSVVMSHGGTLYNVEGSAVMGDDASVTDCHLWLTAGNNADVSGSTLWSCTLSNNAVLASSTVSGPVVLGDQARVSWLSGQSQRQHFTMGAGAQVSHCFLTNYIFRAGDDVAWNNNTAEWTGGTYTNLVMFGDRADVSASAFLSEVAGGLIMSNNAALQTSAFHCTHFTLGEAPVVARSTFSRQATLDLGPSALVEYCEFMEGLNLNAADMATFQRNRLCTTNAGMGIWVTLGDQSTFAQVTATNFIPPFGVVELASHSTFDSNQGAFNVRMAGTGNVASASILSGEIAGVECGELSLSNRVEDVLIEGGFGLTMSGTWHEVVGCVVLSAGAPYGAWISADHTLVRGSTFMFAQNAGLQVLADHVDLQGNLVLSNRTGIYLSGSNVVVGGDHPTDANTIYANAEDGVWVYRGTEVTFTRNLIGCAEKDQPLPVPGNGRHGLLLDGARGVEVGQPFADHGNWIVGSGSNGVHISDFSSGWRSSNVVIQMNTFHLNAVNGIFAQQADELVIQGNYIGSDSADTPGLGNGSGIYLVNTPAARIGGSLELSRNIISGNASNGVTIWGNNTASNSVLLGNYIGTTRSGTAALGNGGHGVQLRTTRHVYVGGTNQHDGNLISGNAGHGVAVTDGGGTNTFYQNTIGLDVGGSNAVANGMDGLYTEGQAFIGGPSTNMGNLISGNAGCGVHARFSSGRTVLQGNRIGTDRSGMLALGNGAQGVYAVKLASNPMLTIGGTNGPGHQAGNLISGNGADGVRSWGTFNGLAVDGNRVGVDATGMSALGNGGHGLWIEIGTSSGGIGTNEGNIVSGNTGHGIYMTRGEFMGIAKNLVGANAALTGVIPNGGDGIHLAGTCRYGTIGQSWTSGYNVVAGNAGHGIVVDALEMTNETFHGYVIQGNWIGVLPGSLLARPNAGNNGIWMKWTQRSYVGANIHALGDPAAGGNVINAPVGLRVDNADFTYVNGNKIGFLPGTGFKSATMVHGVVFSNAWVIRLGAIGIEDAPSLNYIGGASGAGIRIESSSSNALLYGVNVGCAGAADPAPVGNPGHGIELVGASYVTITNCVIRNSGGNGVRIEGDEAVGNCIANTPISGSGGKGILLAGDPAVSQPGPNRWQAAPSLVRVISNDRISGWLTSGTSQTYRVQFFANDGRNAAGYGEGQSLLGAVTVTTDGDGHADVLWNAEPAQIVSGKVYTATATHQATGDTSEFSNWVTEGDVNLVYNAGAGGAIVGPTPQTVSLGGIGQPVQADAEAGAFFRAWNDGVATAARQDVGADGGVAAVARFRSAGGASLDWYVQMGYTPEGGENWSDLDTRIVAAKGTTLLEENIADTNPNDVADVFQCVETAQTDGPSVTFHSSSARLYTLQATDDLLSGPWINVPGAGPRPGVDGPDQLTDENDPPTGRYYRSVVEIP